MTSGTRRELRVTRALVELADTLLDDDDIVDLIELLDRLVARSVELLVEDAAAIVWADPHRVLAVVASCSEDAHRRKLLQRQNHRSPCVDCYRAGAPVSCRDRTHAARRWHAGQASPLFCTGAAAWGADDLAVGRALAEVAAFEILSDRAVLRAEVLNEAWQGALNGRAVLEQATGVVAQHLGLSMDGAADRLRGYARRHDLRLADVARQLIDRDLDPATVFTIAASHQNTGAQ